MVAITQAQQAWKGFYSNKKSNYISSPGSQLLTRLLMGKYVHGASNDYEGVRVLDVGCGYGYNLVTCGLLGMDLYGCDIDSIIVDNAHGSLQKYDFMADLRVGCMDNIPFDDNCFDMLIAWNVIHYAGNQFLLDKVFEEFRRVLRIGGRFWLMTTAPKSYLYEGAIVNGCEYIINRSDFRKGIKTYCFGHEKDLINVLEKNFNNVKVGRSTEDLFGVVEDHYFATAVC